MSIRRKIRIELTPLAAEWKNSYIILRGLSIDDIIDFQKEARKINNDKNEVVEAIQELENRKQTDITKKELETLQEGLDSFASKQLNQARELIERNFISGSIYDFDEEKTREMTKEDLKDLDLGTINYIGESLIGSNQKKIL